MKCKCSHSYSVSFYNEAVLSPRLTGHVVTDKEKSKNLFWASVWDFAKYTMWQINIEDCIQFVFRIKKDSKLGKT
jgi:hypothetical protein